MAFPNETDPFAVHSGMFMPTLANQTTDKQKAKWHDKAYKYEITGTYAQTELGHGETQYNIDVIQRLDSVSWAPNKLILLCLLF